MITLSSFHYNSKFWSNFEVLFQIGFNYNTNNQNAPIKEVMIIVVIWFVFPDELWKKSTRGAAWKL